MGAGETERTGVARDETEHLGPFHDLETIVAEPCEDGEIVRHGRGIYHQCHGGVAEGVGDSVGRGVESYVDTLGTEGIGESRRSAVISCHTLAPAQEVALEGGHAYASGADEIYVLVIFFPAHFLMIFSS